MADSTRWLIDELFVPLLSLVEELEKASSEQEAVQLFGCDRSHYWLRTGDALDRLDRENLLGRDLRKAVTVIARIREGTTTQCNTYPEVAVYIFKRLKPLREAARLGWKATKLGGTVPDDPFPVDTPLHSTEEDLGSSGLPKKQFTTLDQFPASPAGHVAFLEKVRDEIHYAADAKRQQLERGYSNDTLASMVSGIKWMEARARITAIAELLADAVDQVAHVLQRELTVSTVEQIDDLLTAAMRKLRDAWETHKAGSIRSDDTDEIAAAMSREVSSDELLQADSPRLAPTSSLGTRPDTSGGSEQVNETVASRARSVAEKIKNLATDVRESFASTSKEERVATLHEKTGKILVEIFPVVTWLERRRPPDKAELLKRRIYDVCEFAVECAAHEIPEFTRGGEPKSEGEKSSPGCLQVAELAVAELFTAQSLLEWADEIEAEEAKDQTVEAEGAKKKKTNRKAGTSHLRNSVEIFNSALRVHHNYEHPSKEFNYEPASCRTLQELSDHGISDTTAGRLIKEHFGSNENYKAACANRSIREKLTLMMGDVLKSVDPKILEETVPNEGEGD